MEEWPLTAFDQINGGIYVRLLLFFPFFANGMQADLSSPEEKLATAWARNAFAKCLLRWPFLTGTVSPYQGGNQTLGFSQPADPTNTTVVAHGGIFGCSQVDLAPWHPASFEEFEAAGGPAKCCDKNVFTMSPTHPQDARDVALPPATLQVTYVDKDAVVLGFSFHHAVFDGSSIQAFLHFFAKSTWPANHQAPPPTPVTVKPSLERLLSDERSWKLRFAEQQRRFPVYDFGCPVPNFSRPIPRYRGLAPPSSHGRGMRNRCVILRFENRRVRHLHELVSRKLAGQEASVSALDCLCALIWAHAVRARTATMAASTTVKFATVVDPRSRLMEPLPDYFGNLWVATVARREAGAFLRADLARDLDPVAKAACALRKAVDAVDEPFVATRLQLAARGGLHGVGVGEAFRRAIDPVETGIDFSSWASWGHDLDMDLPGALSAAPVLVRKTHSDTNAGALNLLPRRGGSSSSRSNAPWEFLLVLGAAQMEKLVHKNAIGAWARVIENMS